jgi:methionyl aminopeptidase
MSQTDKITAMREGGKRLAIVRDALVQFTRPGLTFAEIEAEAQRLIKAQGCIPNFALVPGYHWATCLMKNDEVCHGIPTDKKVVKETDLIKIDVGLLYQGWNLDTTATVVLPGVNEKVRQFVDVSQKSLKKAIEAVTAGNSVHEVSRAMQKVVEGKGYGMVYQLTGHGIGRELHESPAIPCIAIRSDKRQILKAGQTIAVEVMSTMGRPDLEVDADGWTYRTIDRSWSAMMEETVLVTENGAEILTKR